MKGGGAVVEVTYLRRLSSSQKQSEREREREFTELTLYPVMHCQYVPTFLHVCTVEAVGVSIYGNPSPSTRGLVETQNWNIL